MTTTAPIPGAGDVLGGCRLDRLVARGGMGLVYEATQLTLGRRVALKVISPQLADDPEFRARFVREARVAASVHHPNIVDVYDAGEQDGVLYLVMRFVDGVDLRSVLRREPRLEPGRAVRIVGHVGAALDAAHLAGLAHRDVTPSNILLSGTGNGERAALTDFGLVTHAGSDGTRRTSGWLGTLAFLAPEALRGEPVDGRADVYALGCVLFRMLTGELPFAHESDAAMIASHLHDAPPRPSAVPGAQLGTRFDSVIAGALAKRPGDRFASAGQLAQAAARALDGGPALVPEPGEQTAITRVAGAPATAASAATRVDDRPQAAADPARAPARAGPKPPRRRSAATLRAAIALAALLLGAALGIAADRTLRSEPRAARSPRAVPRTPVAVTLEPYATAAYSAEVPRGWITTARELDRGDYVESRWRAPFPGRAELSITYREGSGAAPEQIAQAARGRLAQLPSYSEIALAPVTLGSGTAAQQWVYGLEGQARTSWFMNPCGTSIAIYARTRPAEVARWAPTFAAVADGLQPSCATAE